MTAPGLLRMELPAWRLSRIEEELEGLSVTDDALDSRRGKSLPGSRESTLSRATGADMLPPPPEFPLPPYPSTGSLGETEEDIYSKAILADKDRQMEEMYAAKEAARFLSEKYDSLGRIHSKPSLQQQHQPVAAHHGQAAGHHGQPASQSALPQGYGTFPGARKHRDEDRDNRVVVAEQKMPTPPLSVSNEDFGSLPEPPSGPAISHYPYGGGLDMLPLTDQDIVQVEMFYRSHKTDVFVCQCMVHLYIGTARGGSPGIHPGRLVSMVGAGAMPESGGENWTFMKSGVVVVVMDTGESRRQRKLHIILAERGTGFILWKEIMNHLTNYTARQPCFHTMHLSNDHTKLAGFRFQDAAAAAQFLQKICTLTSDPEDSLLKLSGSGKGTSVKKGKDKKSKSKSKHKLPTKADISSPCCFTHVTKLDRSDGMCMLTSPHPASPSREMSMSMPASGLKANPRI